MVLSNGAALPILIWEVPISNFGVETDYLMVGFIMFPQHFQANSVVRVLSEIRTRPLPSPFFTVHPHILTFDTI
jgi:hypothetical protein